MQLPTVRTVVRSIETLNKSSKEDHRKDAATLQTQLDERLSEDFQAAATSLQITEERRNREALRDPINCVRRS